MWLLATILVSADLNLHLGMLQESDSKLIPIHNSVPPWATLDSWKDRPLFEYLLLQGTMKSPFMSFISFNSIASDIKYRIKISSQTGNPASKEYPSTYSYMEPRFRNTKSANYRIPRIPILRGTRERSRFVFRTLSWCKRFQMVCSAFSL